jgi:uncharacterized membrane protein
VVISILGNWLLHIVKLGAYQYSYLRREFHHRTMSNPSIALVAFTIPAPVFGPYIAGLTVVMVGLVMILRDKRSQEQGIERFVRLGPLLFAAPMAVFGAEHLTVAKDIATAIPHWIPAHLFWTYLVGVALISAALSIVSQRLSGLAATLLGIMLFCFVLLIHIPRLAANPRDRIVVAVVLRDLAFSAGAFALASTRANEAWRSLGQKAATVARYVVGSAALFFGVEHFLHPQFVPVVPLGLAMPAWIPLHRFWAYSVGVMLLAAGLAMFTNWHARRMTTWLGIVVVGVVLLVYLPILVAHPSDIGVAMNYFADTLAVGGNFLILASSMPKAGVRLRPRQEFSAEQSSSLASASSLHSGADEAKPSTIELTH